MKADRFIRVALTLIAVLLALSCGKDSNQPSNSSGNSGSLPGSTIDPSRKAPIYSEAAPVPSFFQAGKLYVVDTAPALIEKRGFPSQQIKQNGKTLKILPQGIVRVLQIENGGWIYVEEAERVGEVTYDRKMWLNTNQMKIVSEYR